ncbi:flagellar brake protein [Marinimicrobium alkaliphilum]|uniref:flagellar brake protein n=1 Tax=Marinimicrobium alkaliphilum TaxID=2202654 RepID=UPI000DB9A2F9|nr:flagellar brake protein [Marinimicrobium alkaliphilum]
MTLFENVIQKLAGRKSGAPSQAPTPGARAQQPSRAEQLLLNLAHQHQLLEVRIEGETQRFQSMILAVDTERGLIWLDDLFPRFEALLPGDSIDVQHQRGWESLNFGGPLLALGASFGATGFALALPEVLGYQPRRQSPRWQVPDYAPLRVKMRANYEEPSFGRLLNLSAGGMRIALPGNQQHLLRRDTLLTLVEVPLDQQFTLRCRARVRNLRLARSPYRHTQVSLEFAELTPEQREQLTRFVNVQLSLAVGSTRAA